MNIVTCLKVLYVFLIIIQLTNASSQQNKSNRLIQIENSKFIEELRTQLIQDQLEQDKIYWDRYTNDLVHGPGTEETLNYIYFDKAGNKTYGIGHKVSINEPEYLLSMGSKISQDIIEKKFDVDIYQAIYACEHIWPDFDNLYIEIKLVLANMMYNVGSKNFIRFSHMIEALHFEDYSTAADSMIRTVWFKQETHRARRLVRKMFGISHTFYNIKND